MSCEFGLSAQYVGTLDFLRKKAVRGRPSHTSGREIEHPDAPYALLIHGENEIAHSRVDLVLPAFAVERAVVSDIGLKVVALQVRPQSAVTFGLQVKADRGWACKLVACES